ncbi:MAG: carboxypeptidase regulatory-like domain-containing protein, partial [Candidatus Sericytochromatia bacterium]|nr:carboxypeptidase regulatory-like domain-containing protein [Candidatus Sericytochromatia bacterium]
MTKRTRLFKSASLPLVVALAIAGCVPGVLPLQSAVPRANSSATQAVSQEVLAAGIVKGRVKAYDFASKKFVPVAGAAIVVAGTNFRATTDSQGFYTLTGVAKGQHTLIATKQGLIKAEAPIHVNGVLGIADVDLAMGKPAYGLKQASGLDQSDLQVYGVVRDPRGCAVPNANLFVTSSSGSIQSSVVNDEVTVIGSDGTSEAARVTTASGFYIFTVTNADDFTRVSISASGRTRGGIPLERARTTSQPVGTYAVDRLDADAGTGRTVTDQSTGGKEVTGTWAQGFDIQLNKFVGTRNPVALGTYVTGGHVKVRVLEGLSSRPDEFFVRLRQGNEEYDIVPIAVEDVAGSQIAKDVTFRLPSTLSTRTNFNVKIMQLGIEASPQSPWLRATAFTEAEFRLVTATSAISTLTDDTS